MSNSKTVPNMIPKMEKKQGGNPLDLCVDYYNNINNNKRDYWVLVCVPVSEHSGPLPSHPRPQSI